MRRRLQTMSLVLATAVVLPIGAGQAAAQPLPVIYNGALGYAQASPTASPPGANDWSCRPGRAHPRPVVLVHGTFADMSDSWQALSPLLHNNGYCVFALNYGSYEGSGETGVYAVGDIAESAAQLSAFVDRVRASTRARRVDLVGHSQGGMMPRYYLKHLGGARRVRTLVGLSPSNHGTDLDGLFTLAALFPGPNPLLSRCPSCEQQAAGSTFLTELNSSAETMRGVRYTVIQSMHDEVVTPYTSAFLAGPAVTNVLLQDQCPLDRGEHLSMPYDHIADRDVLNALDPAHAVQPACTPVAPVAGG